MRPPLSRSLSRYYLAFGALAVATAFCTMVSLTNLPQAHALKRSESKPEQHKSDDLPLLFCGDPDARCTWEYTFGGALAEKAYGVAALPDGGIAVAGHRRSPAASGYDGWVFRLDRSGQMQWEQAVGGRGNDQLYAVAVLSDGRLVAAGATDSREQGNRDAWVICLDAAKTLWEDTFGGPGSDRVRGMVKSGPDQLVLVGTTSDPASAKGDAWIFKINGEGRMLWERRFRGAGDDGFFQVAAAGDGTLLATGYSEKSNEPGYDLWIMKMTSDGEPIWDRRVGRGCFDAGTALAATPDNGVIVAGVTSADAFSRDDAWALRLDPQGDIVWSKTFGGPKPDSVWGLVPTTAERYVLVAASSSVGAGSADAWLVCLNSSGERVWERVYGGKLWDRPTAVAAAADGGFFIIGYTTSKGAGYEDIWILRLDSDGRL